MKLRSALAAILLLIPIAALADEKSNLARALLKELRPLGAQLNEADKTALRALNQEQLILTTQHHDRVIRMGANDSCGCVVSRSEGAATEVIIRAVSP